MTRSPLYPRNDHDIALGIIDQEVTGIKFASIGGDASKGVDITLAGYGCVRPGGGGGNDGILRVGDNRVINLSGYDMVSRMQGGGALCFGDSGGPAFLRDTNILLGVNSKGNIQDTNYNTRTDTQASRDFFAKFAQQTGVEICGINKDCGDESKPAPEPQGDCATNAHAVNNAKRLLAVRVDEMMSCMGLAAFN
jgi:hypothetical protein